MKLLIANHHLRHLAGSELHTLDLCRGFRRAGHEVVVFTLVSGLVTDILEEENFRVLSLRNLGSLSEETFDLVYLHHSTCEVLVGLLFAGRVPIVRGYLGIVPPLENPTNGHFLSAALYAAGGARRYFPEHHPDIPSSVAYNVYDDQRVILGTALGWTRPDKPNFAVVTNHLDPNLKSLLVAATEKGLCRFTHIGRPHNSLLVTADLLLNFDAVITIGRTVLLAAALGMPVYVCDRDGADGWLAPWNFGGSRYCGYSGWLLEIRDWDFVLEQLLDTSHWPTVNDLTWLCEQVARDHALSRRIEQLEAFFAEVIEKSPLPAPVPKGGQAVLQFIEESEQARHDLAAHAEKLTLQVQSLEQQVQSLEQQMRDIRDSRTWRLLMKLGRVRAKVWGK